MLPFSKKKSPKTQSQTLLWNMQSDLLTTNCPDEYKNLLPLFGSYNWHLWRSIPLIRTAPVFAYALLFEDTWIYQFRTMMQMLPEKVHSNIVNDILAAGKFNQLVYNYPIRIPERFSLVIRSLLTQEGICLTLEPGFKFLEVKHLAFQFATSEEKCLFTILSSLISHLVMLLVGKLEKLLH